MHKMHRACQDNYYSDLFIQSEGRDKPSGRMSKDELTRIAIRKLTPKEAFMLQGFDEDFFSKVQNSGNSNTQLYKQAGNTICVACLESIFRVLFKEELKHE